MDKSIVINHYIILFYYSNGEQIFEHHYGEPKEKVIDYMTSIGTKDKSLLQASAVEISNCEVIHQGYIYKKT